MVTGYIHGTCLLTLLLTLPDSSIHGVSGKPKHVSCVVPNLWPTVSSLMYLAKTGEQSHHGSYPSQKTPLTPLLTYLSLDGF